MIDELRTLADTLSKATPGPWEVSHDYTLSGPITITPDGKKCAEWIAEIDWDNRDDVDEEGYSERASADACAMIAARSSEDLLRQAADELERLRNSSTTGVVRASLKYHAEEVDRLKQAIQDAVDDLQNQRVADWFPEGAHNAADAMSESMRQIANRLVDVLSTETDPLVVAANKFNEVMEDQDSEDAP